MSVLPQRRRRKRRRADGDSPEHEASNNKGPGSRPAAGHGQDSSSQHRRASRRVLDADGAVADTPTPAAATRASTAVVVDASVPGAGPLAAVALSDWLGNDASVPASLATLARLLHAGAALPRHVGLLARALQATDDADLRLEAARGLGALGPSLVRPSLPALVALAGAAEPSERVRAAAIEAMTGAHNPELATIASPSVVAQTIKALEDASPVVRRAASAALASQLAPLLRAEKGKGQGKGQGQDDDVGALARLLHSRSTATREAALGVLSGLAARPDHDALPCCDAVRALDAAVATLASKDPAPRLRALALAFLGRLPLRLAQPHLGSIVIPRLGDCDPGVQAAALAALERLQQDKDAGAAPLAEALRRHAGALVELFLHPPQAPPASSSPFPASPRGKATTRHRTHRTRMTVLRALSSFIPAAALEPFVGALAASVGWGEAENAGEEERRHTGAPEAEGGPAAARAAGAGATQQQQQQQSLPFPLPLRSLLLESPLLSPSSSSPSSSHRGRRAFSPGTPPRPHTPASPQARPRRLIFDETEENDDARDEGEPGAQPSKEERAESEALQDGVLALLGRMRTSLVLPFLPAVARSLLHPRLTDPCLPDAAALEATQAALAGIKNLELRRQCHSRLLLLLNPSSSSSSSSGARRLRVLSLATAVAAQEEESRRKNPWVTRLPSLLPLLPPEADAVAACLADPAARVRQAACLLLLRSLARLPPGTRETTPPPHARAVVAFLRRERELEWLGEAVNGDDAGLRSAASAVLLPLLLVGGEDPGSNSNKDNDKGGKENAGGGGRWSRTNAQAAEAQQVLRLRQLLEPAKSGALGLACKAAGAGAKAGDAFGSPRRAAAKQKED